MKMRSNAYSQGGLLALLVQRGMKVLPRQTSIVVVALTLCTFCMSISAGMTLTIFTHLFKNSGSGVVMLSLMMTIPHLALLLLAPLMGYLADRYRRFPFLILPCAGLALTNLCNIFAHQQSDYLLIQIAQSIVCAGARPAMMGILASAVPTEQRPRQLSLIMAGLAGGLALGPVLSGFLIQRGGTELPFELAAVINLLALGLAWRLIPRTHIRQEAPLSSSAARRSGWFTSLRQVRLALIIPASLFLGLLLLDFLLAFERAFVEPHVVIYLTRTLHIPSLQLGMLLSCQGVAMLIGTLLSSYAGRLLGRQLTVTGGYLLRALFILSLLLMPHFPLLLLAALISGIGGGLVFPLLGTCYLDTVRVEAQGRISGIKEAVAACGALAGALPILLGSHWISPQMTFVVGGCLIAGGGLLALVVVEGCLQHQQEEEITACAEA